MSAHELSQLPGQWKMRWFPQGSLALLGSRYFCDTSSSIPRGQLLALSIMYCAVASLTAFTRSLAVDTLECLQTGLVAIVTPTQAAPHVSVVPAMMWA